MCTVVNKLENIDFRKELGRAAIAAVVAFVAGLILRALGAEKWFIAAGSGAAGGLAAVAVVR
jgi:hypothetical protein